MTYQELLEIIQSMNEENRNTNVTVYSETEDEFHPIESMMQSNSDNNDILDDGHYYLKF